MGTAGQSSSSIDDDDSNSNTTPTEAEVEVSVVYLLAAPTDERRVGEEGENGGKRDERDVANRKWRETKH